MADFSPELINALLGRPDPRRSAAREAVEAPQSIDRNARNVGPLTPVNKFWLDTHGAISEDPINDEGKRLALGVMGGSVRFPLLPSWVGKTAVGMPRRFVGSAPESPVQPGLRDNTGPWFLEGDKPMYGNASREALNGLFGPEYAKRFDAYRKFDVPDADGNPGAFWVKHPGQLTPDQINAINDMARHRRTFSPSRATQEQLDEHHRLGGRAYGYDPTAIEDFIAQMRERPK